jgi:hypothetical protein
MDHGAAVECYSGVRFAERPVSFQFQGRRHLVDEVIKQWISPSAYHFEVRTTEDESFELTYYRETDEWAIVKLAAGPADEIERGAQ